jgi:lysozyme
MCFNLGINTLLTFKNTLTAVSLGNYEQAAIGMRNSTWFKQVGNRAVRLANAIQTGIMSQ